VLAVHGKLARTPDAFELFGLDFMIDEDLCTWLIEANTNPCIETV
jgi:D-alanine-D-alanine ligase-like ATP-grasp enzyme